MKKAERILTGLTTEDKADLLVALSSEDLSAYDESSQFEIDLIGEYADEIKFNIENWGKHQGLDFGYAGINQMTLGMTDGEVMLLSGDSSHGKTQLSLNLAYKQAKEGRMVFFITLEMTQGQIGSRLVKIAMQDGMSMDDALALPITVQRTTKLSYKNIPHLVKQAKDGGAQIVFLDHVHSFRPEGQINKTQEVAAISDAIKKAALENLIPIVALCQCRKLEDATGKPRRPNKNDLKDAAELYQDSDICIMVWRDLFSNGGENADIVEARIWKNRLRGFRTGHNLKLFQSKEGAGMVEVEATPSEKTSGLFPVNR